MILNHHSFSLISFPRPKSSLEGENLGGAFSFSLLPLTLYVVKGLIIHLFYNIPIILLAADACP